MEDASNKQKISVDQYRNHPRKKRHPQLIRMILYLILSLGIGWYLYSNLSRTDKIKEEDEHEEFEVEIEI